MSVLVDNGWHALEPFFGLNYRHPAATTGDNEFICFNQGLDAAQFNDSLWNRLRNNLPPAAASVFLDDVALVFGD